MKRSPPPLLTARTAGRCLCRSFGGRCLCRSFGGRVPPLVVSSVLVSLLVVVALGCIPRPRPLAPIARSRVFVMSPGAQCSAGYGEPSSVGAVAEDNLAEASGVVASPTHPGVLWLHNDSGDEARLFAISTTGAALGELELPGVNSDDFEDIAAAPCPDLLAACLYICDCGDNALARDDIVVYAVLEPDVAPDRPLADGSAAQQIWRYQLEVPGGAANIEAFVVLPDATAMVFFEKEREARVLRFLSPWNASDKTTLDLASVMTAPGPDVGGGGVITGASIHPSGQRLLLRTYIGVFEALVEPSGLGAAGIDGTEFTELFRPDEPQGESIAYDEAGTGIWTLSESPDRTPNQPLHHAVCR